MRNEPDSGLAPIYVFCHLPQNMPMLCPPEYMVCFLHRLVSALRFYWDEYKASNPHASFSEGKHRTPGWQGWMEPGLW